MLKMRDNVQDSTVIAINKLKKKDLTETAGWILDRCMNHEIKGICFIVEHENETVTVGVSGHCTENPFLAMHADNILHGMLERLAAENIKVNEVVDPDTI